MHASHLDFAKCWLDTALTFFYPDLCQICSSECATAREGYVCGQCYQNLRFIKPPFCERCGLPFEGEMTAQFECSNCREMDLHFLSARAAVAARGTALDVIHRYKYQRALWFEPFLFDLLRREAEPVLRDGRWDLIVPVPLFPLKKREREFNQAEHLAAGLGAAIGIPVNTRLLERVQHTRTQTLLTRSQRADNVRNAFCVRAKSFLQGQRIVLVDDVLTTGATTSACAKALKAAGAGDVSVWTVARGI